MSEKVYRIVCSYLMSVDPSRRLTKISLLRLFLDASRPTLIDQRRRMKAIVVMDQAEGTAGMTLVARPEPQAALNDVVVQVHAPGYTPGELTWFSTWTDRFGHDRTPSIPTGRW
ncbi:hypothetical protein [Streptomyces sp. NPDC093261]|uniref:hypothetical protein n=1 Tax=Streptomyces sp. NPDC093261 TaxID=3366037 RepID=UPI0038307E18